MTRGMPKPPMENVTHNGTGNAYSQQTEQWYLWTLPDIELGCIMDFLPWQDKLNLLSACPQLNRVLMSPLGWRTFQAGAVNPCTPIAPSTQLTGGCYGVKWVKSGERLKDEMACVEKYGQFFQHCTIWLGKPCRSSWECTCVFDSANGDDVFPLLAALADRCKVLKSLRLYHPSHVTPESSDTHIFKQYQQSIEKLLMHALHRTNFTLELCGLQYSNDHIRPISLRFLDYYVSNPQVSKLITVLDVHRTVDNRQHPIAPLPCLDNMKYLVTLKVPIHCLTLATVQTMVDNVLVDLYLLSDDCTVDMSYMEQQHLHWTELAVSRDRHFSVHYIFRQRTLSSADLVPNPFVKSVCIDSPCKLLTEGLLLTVAEKYGSTLQLMALCHSAWQPQIALLDLSDFAAKCPKLTLFISTLMHDSSVLLSLMQSSHSLRDVLVTGHSAEMVDFLHIVSQTLCGTWHTSTYPALFYVSGWELSFLVDEYILRHCSPFVIHRIK